MPAKVISFAIQKGGTGKTTGAYNLAWLLAEMGREVLAIDLDPQASLTEFTGTPPSDIAHAMMTGEEWQPMRPEGHIFDLVPANIDLADAEMGLITRPTWGLTLNEAIAQVRDSYDYIIVDAPPSLGVLTTNALLAADGVIIPVQTESEAVRGMALLMKTMKRIAPRVPIVAIQPTQYKGGGRSGSGLHKDILAGLQQVYGDKVAEAVKDSVRYPESALAHQPIYRYAPDLADAWHDLAARVERWSGYAG